MRAGFTAGTMSAAEQGGDEAMNIKLHYDVPGDDFTRAGEASGAVKRTLKQLGFSPDLIRRVSMVLTDHGPGIPDVEQAMQEGWSTAPDNVRSLGFGAGMGLPNIKKYTDYMDIKTEIGAGTRMTLVVRSASS